ncbi:PLP-dependent aminotransferase family protein [Butyrivibrio sp. INlla16]|uniref:MocR-like pyridoxine biosynthesis transcription factor PdxR n=1 Tax=Butyrivibrio sp. INlla16 TaxID=1520807 RepID=UPI0008853F24|nr:PLP-dependent aminotransferase family protein [Butyrivibrio sp. INlla16]SDB22611.1 GntR family transcriptional regulator / MocR family aminotransferase [Butyrivibrio sp. INlla16]
MDKQKRYLKVYEDVREDIIGGRYETGSKLPSKRVMAEAMGVSVITIEHAYELLAEEGYIIPKEKSGYFVSFDDSEIYIGKGSAEKKTVMRGNKISVAKNIGEAAFSYSIYAKTVRRVLSEYDSRVMEKSPKTGMNELRSAIANYLGRSRRLEVSPEQIIIGAGAEYLYGLIVQTFGRDIIYGVESPSYQKIAKVYEAGGAELLMLKLGSDGVESDELWNGKMKLLHITPYRSFPSGVTASAAKKREYLKWSRKKDGYIIEDDFESEFTPSRKPEETIFSLDEEGRVIYVNTFTRTIGSYARCAYMVLPMNLISAFSEKIGFYECPVPTLDQLVIAELIESGDFERHINKVRRYNRKGAQSQK